jgi:hypothetical protein
MVVVFDLISDTDSVFQKDPNLDARNPVPVVRYAKN